MSNINLKRFVDINIQAKPKSSIDGTRNSITLFSPEGELNTIKTFNSLAEVDYVNTTDTYKYLEMFFANGGVKAIVYEGISYSTLTKEMITSLPNEQIYVACVVPANNREDGYSALKTIAQAMEADTTIYGINEKLILATTHASEADTDVVKNFVVKYSTIVGAEMTIAAYLSQIDVNGIDTVQDYAFTQERITAENITDAVYEELSNANINVDIMLSGTVRNCGGNCKDGSDVVNNFVRIILHQTLTAQLLILLTQKIKSTTGVSKLYTVISQELERYLSCGYLTTDKVWLDNDLKVTINNSTYTIINKGDTLLNGYVIKILPMSALSDADRAAHKAPPIYVIIADQYGIRKITINGDVI